jgi:hypothetical protein
LVRLKPDATDFTLVRLKPDATDFTLVRLKPDATDTDATDTDATDHPEGAPIDAYNTVSSAARFNLSPY